MPPMIGETLLLYLDPRSTCGRSDFADNIIGQLPCHSLQQASRGALIVYIRVYPVPNLATGGGGFEARVESVSSRLCVCCVGQWKTPGPGSWFLPEQYLKTEDGASGFVGVEQRLWLAEIHFSCPFKGIAGGPKIGFGLRPVSEAGGLMDPRRRAGLHHRRCISWQGGFIQ